MAFGHEDFHIRAMPWSRSSAFYPTATSPSEICLRATCSPAFIKSATLATAATYPQAYRSTSLSSLLDKVDDAQDVHECGRAKRLLVFQSTNLRSAWACSNPGGSSLLWTYRSASSNRATCRPGWCTQQVTRQEHCFADESCVLREPLAYKI